MQKNSRGIAPADADVVQHGGFQQELVVGVQLWVATADEQAPLSNLFGMTDEQSAQCVVIRVILVYNCLIVNHYFDLLFMIYYLLFTIFYLSN